jgi:hypothetical protein
VTELPTKPKSKFPSLNFDIVMVLWEDAHSDAAWTLAEDVKLDPCLATTVGFLYRQDADRLLVADSIILNTNGSVNSISGTTIIPVGMLRELKVIKKGKG